MNSRRVVITGIGTICCSGVGKEAFWKSLLEGRTGISRISSFDPKDLHSQVAGEVKDFNAKDFMDAKEAKRMDRFNQFSIAATKLALEDGGSYGNR